VCGQDLGESDIHGTDRQRQLSKSGEKIWVCGASANQSELLDVGEIWHLVRKVDGHVRLDETEG
jgi:hypothetical protein